MNTIFNYSKKKTWRVKKLYEGSRFGFSLTLQKVLNSYFENKTVQQSKFIWVNTGTDLYDYRPLCIFNLHSHQHHLSYLMHIIVKSKVNSKINTMVQCTGVYTNHIQNGSLSKIKNWLTVTSCQFGLGCCSNLSSKWFFSSYRSSFWGIVATNLLIIMNHSLSYYEDAKNLGSKLLIYRLKLYLTLNFCLDYITWITYTPVLKIAGWKRLIGIMTMFILKNIYLIVNQIKNNKFNF